MTTERLALVLGGTGAVGREVVHALVRENVRVVFTHNTRGGEARQLATETCSETRPLDLTDDLALPALMAALDPAPDIFVHCAGVSRQARLEDLDVVELRRTLNINSISTF